MREFIATGKNVEEATEIGCRELGLTRDEVSVEILEMPSRRLFKTTPAKVKVTANEAEEAPVAAPEKPAVAAEKKTEKKPDKTLEKPRKNPEQKKNQVLPAEPEVQIDLTENAGAARAVAYLTEIFTAMNAGDFSVTAFQQGDATLLRIEGKGVQQVIETKGETVQALSYLTDRAVNKGVDKKDKEYLRIRLDIAGYRGRREGELIALATRTGKDVQRTKRSKTLSPMNPYERLIIHTTISGMEGLMSESIGSDAERRVVVKSTAEDATDGPDWQPPRRGGNGRGNNRDRNNSRGGNNRGPRRDGGRDGNRDNRRGGGPRREGGRPTSTPEREYANKAPNPDAKPIVPERREVLKDGEDLPLYGKIEI